MIRVLTFNSSLKELTFQILLLKNNIHHFLRKLFRYSYFFLLLKNFEKLINWGEDANKEQEKSKIFPKPVIGVPAYLTVCKNIFTYGIF